MPIWSPDLVKAPAFNRWAWLAALGNLGSQQRALVSPPDGACAVLCTCSATWPREVKNIASQFVTNQTVHVFIGGVEDKLVANKAITQRVRVSAWARCGQGWKGKKDKLIMMQCA